ncbi:hypothetical protein Sputw3181_1874 [Shewanella sp. W3-18-1]|nr:hypothetical protein Sputw3181_1874 [Shewanella sp. W3-18-1]
MKNDVLTSFFYFTSFTSLIFSVFIKISSQKPSLTDLFTALRKLKMFQVGYFLDKTLEMSFFLNMMKFCSLQQLLHPRG